MNSNPGTIIKNLQPSFFTSMTFAVDYLKIELGLRFVQSINLKKPMFSIIKSKIII